jgi:reductive dehalogenase
MGGRQVGEDWGRRLEPTHEFAIVIATEMAFDLVRCAPHSATTIESARNYADGAIISTSLAQYIANLGYSATAEHFAHYQSLMVPLAVDAGLGELGRHGYLVTKELGSRLRLAAVTTNMALVTDQPIDIGVADFCSLCKKCADCCPSGSIPKDGPKEVNGTLRWKMNAESCHDYWGRIGTDCNICMRVCPWSHDKTFPHRVVSWAVSRNKFARCLVMVMDDLFYGKKPRPTTPPEWADFKSGLDA